MLDSTISTSPEANLWAAVIAQTIQDAFKPMLSLSAELDQREALRFLLEPSGPWAASRRDLCELLGLDPDVLHKWAQDALAGRVPLQFFGKGSRGELESKHREKARAIWDAMNGRGEVKAPRPRRPDQPAPKPRAVAPLPKWVEPAPVEGGRPIARFEFMEVGDLPLGYIVRLDDWQGGDYCTNLKAYLPNKSSPLGQALMRATCEKGAFPPMMSDEAMSRLYSVARLLNLEVLFQDRDGNPVTRRAAMTARLRPRPRIDA